MTVVSTSKGSIDLTAARAVTVSRSLMSFVPIVLGFVLIGIGFVTFVSFTSDFFARTGSVKWWEWPIAVVLVVLFPGGMAYGGYGLVTAETNDDETWIGKYFGWIIAGCGVFASVLLSISAFPQSNAQSLLPGFGMFLLGILIVFSARFAGRKTVRIVTDTGIVKFGGIESDEAENISRKFVAQGQSHPSLNVVQMDGTN